MTSTPVTHTSTPLAPAGTEATPSQYVAMPAERPQGIAPLYVPNTLHASKKCHFPLSAVEISRHGSTAARPPLFVHPSAAAAHCLPGSPPRLWSAFRSIRWPDCASPFPGSLAYLPQAGHNPPGTSVSAIFLVPMSFLHTFRAELRPTLRLALPLVLAEIGWMSMFTVDTMMVGRLPYSAQAIGAISISSSLFLVFAFFGEGLLIGLDTLVSQAFGAGRREDCHRSLLNGIYLSFAIAPFLALPVWFLPVYFERFGVAHDVAVLATPYMRTLAAGLLPLLLYFAVRRTLQGMNMVRPIAFALVTANLVNIAGNYLLIFGKLGFPALGVTGSGIANAISRTYLAFVLVVYLLWYDARHKTELLKTPVQPDLDRIKQLISLDR